MIISERIGFHRTFLRQNIVYVSLEVPRNITKENC